MNKVEKLVQFWGLLAFFVRAEELTEDGIKMLVDLRGEIDCGIPKEEFTADYIRELHRAHHSDKMADFDTINDLVDTGFEDLSRYLRIPRARKVFAQLRDMVDADERDLFLRIVNVKNLDDSPKGCAVVTLVVHDYEMLLAFLQNKNAVEGIRYSNDTETA